MAGGPRARGSGLLQDGRLIRGLLSVKVHVEAVLHGGLQGLGSWRRRPCASASSQPGAPCGTGALARGACRSAQVDVGVHVVSPPDALRPRRLRRRRPSPACLGRRAGSSASPRCSGGTLPPHLTRSAPPLRPKLGLVLTRGMLPRPRRM